MTQQTDFNQIQAESLNLTEHHIEQLKQLFPNVFTEGKIDFDALKSELGEVVETESERYQFTWAGKEQAKRIATTPSLGTLRPAPDESVNWDSTENLYIEGDNLEVLKLLQKSYGPKPGSNGGKVKMIYIDPPYNTGEDFVYEDDFKDNLANYQRLTGQKDEEGNPLTTNSESAGRYHSNWLNMMYPRLKLARNLLREDGVIFISIDDNEVHNLRKIADEIFGEDNFVCNFAWEKRTNRENRKIISYRHESILAYVKSRSKKSEAISQLPMDEKALSNYKNPDNDPRGLWKSDPATAQAGHGTKSQFYVYTAPNGKEHQLPSGRCWLYTKEVFDEMASEGRIWFGKDGNGVPRVKTYLHAKERGLTPESIWFAKDAFTTEKSKNAIKELFDDVAVFETPKPTELLKIALKISASEGIILDFFSGSATTAHAVMQLNAEDGGNRKFILVQIPEPTPENSEARKAGYTTIAEIGKERIRRAAKKIKVEHPDTQADLGFKVLKLDTSNIKKWNPNIDTLETDLLDAVDNILPDRTAEDLLYEVLIKYGLPLTLPIKKTDINSNGQTYQAWSVAHNSLVACFDENITLETVQAIADLSTPENSVLRVVFRDTSFTDDITKTYAIQRLKQVGIEDVLSI
ncbi:site-specific DNA-methyltransferase [Thiomicrospira microaerophila]|uniref:site-specific DNA-methyltransferase n=1 Tax=Thiomicrospira microaerophila TaxID=406020 RepID=UPI00200CBD4E|nr:site-specific DNA-methyltransferase [Thiomicrospira microaerophila]UQB41797.1 site-specific DNA-methyltransferase [Thiomicrospira microaerophila]